MELRPYQVTGIGEIRSRFAAGDKRVVYVAPCGSGKTVLMSHMATQAARKGNRSLWLAHRREIIEQSMKAVSEHPLITIDSVQTIARRLDRIKPPDLIIVDESHHVLANTWRRILDSFPGAYVVGLTATPQRIGGQGLGDVFQSMVLGPGAAELIRRGYLTPYKYYAPPGVADMEGIRIKLGDFDSEEIEIRVNKPKVIGDAVDHYCKLAFGKQAIAYCASILHSKNTAAAFQAAGITAQHVDGTTPKTEREQIVEKFRSGEITMLTNVDLFGEGVDCPAMEAVILLRPTASLTLYIQQSMRGMRPDKKNPFKTAVVLDHVGNVHRHGLPDSPREWSLESHVRRRAASEKSVGVRYCPQCFGAHSLVQACPYCGHEYQVTARQLAEEAGELKQYDAEQAARESLRKRITLNECKTIADLQAFANDNGYKSGWVRIRAKLKGIRT